MFRLLWVIAGCCLCSCSAAWLDYYEIMKIPQGATLKETKKAFRMRALELHPDKNSSPNAESLFRDLVQAYETLTDPSARSVYDSSYASSKEFAKNNPPAPPPPAKSPNSEKPKEDTRHEWPNYHEFYRNFDENMKRHFEEHAKLMSKTLGPGIDAHMQAHAKAHAEHMRIHAKMAGIGQQQQQQKNQYTKDPNADNKWQQLLGDIMGDADENDSVLREHVDFLKKQEKSDATEGKHHSQRSRTCSKVSETVNGVTTTREHCSES